MKNLFKYTQHSVAIAALSLLAPISSHAFIIDSNTALNSQFTVNFLLEDQAFDGNGNKNNFVPAQDLSAQVIFTLLSYDTTLNAIGFQMDVTNTSALLGNEIGLQAFAFGTDPNATGITLTQQSVTGDVNKFISAALEIDENLNNAVANLDVQTSTGVGYNSTLQEQQWDRFLLDVSFSSIGADGVNFTPFGSKWQGDPDSFQFGGSENGFVDPGNGDNDVPEPGILLLLGAGLIGLSLSRRRQV